MPIFMKEAAGQPYMPSNGTEGACFHELHCSNCERDKVMNGDATIEQADRDPSLYCQILTQSFCVDQVDEWKFGPDGWPMCTSFTPKGQEPQPERCTSTADMFEADDRAIEAAKEAK